MEFQDGFNIVVAENATDSSQETRNGVGKSSIIEILHFLLGSSSRRKTVLATSELDEFEFSLSMDWPTTSTDLKVSRSLSKPSVISLSPNVVGSSSDVLTSGQATRLEWVEELGRQLFGIDPETKALSARSMLSQYIRRQSQNGFTDPVIIYPRQSIAAANTNAAYLLGLDWKLASEYQDLAEREATRRALKRALNSPTFSNVVGSRIDLEAAIRTQTRRVDELDQEISSFKIVPEFESLQQEADSISLEMSEMRMASKVFRRNRKDLERSMEDQPSADVSYVARVFEELRVQLSDQVKNTYADVEGFHKSVLANRRKYLQDELDSLTRKIDAIEARQNELGVRYQTVMTELDGAGALENFNTLITQANTEQSKLQDLQRKLDLISSLDETDAEIKLKRSTLRVQTNLEIEERSIQVAEIQELFSGLVDELYGKDRDATLRIGAEDRNMIIEPHISGEESKGITMMSIFCYDFTTAILANRAGRGPDFLVHDSHIFDGVDERQIAACFRLAEQLTRQEKIQYIVTANSDVLANVEASGLNIHQYFVKPQLSDDHENGGLFGFGFD